MNFDLTDEQEQMRALVREFAEEVVAPGAAERDEHETFPLEIVRAMARARTVRRAAPRRSTAGWAPTR